jgi:anti-sigma-K factor RskA
MTISDESLMAYADGELEAGAREAVESAMRADPEIATRIARHRALRQRVQAAYSAELSEAVPERLLIAARAAATPASHSNVVNMRDVRTTRDLDQSAARPLRPQRPRWRNVGAIAASVMLGAGLGFMMWGRTESSLVRRADGALVARGQLAKALSDQLVAEQARASSVLIGLSFLAKSGDYCRTFVLAGTASSAGLACRHGDAWQVQALVAAPGGIAGNPDYRPAGSEIPPVILNAVEAQMAGEPLTEAAERAVRQRGWIRPDTH